MGAQRATVGSGIYAAVGLCPLSFADLQARLRSMIRERKLNVSALARRCGVSQPALSNWLVGRRELSPSVLDLVRVVVGVNWCDLLSCEMCAHRPNRSQVRCGGTNRHASAR